MNDCCCQWWYDWYGHVNYDGTTNPISISMEEASGVFRTPSIWLAGADRDGTDGTLDTSYDEGWFVPIALSATGLINMSLTALSTADEHCSIRRSSGSADYDLLMIDSDNKSVVFRYGIDSTLPTTDNGPTLGDFSSLYPIRRAGTMHLPEIPDSIIDFNTSYGNTAFPGACTSTSEILLYDINNESFDNVIFYANVGGTGFDYGENSFVEYENPTCLTLKYYDCGGTGIVQYSDATEKNLGETYPRIGVIAPRVQKCLSVIPPRPVYFNDIFCLPDRVVYWHVSKTVDQTVYITEGDIIVDPSVARCSGGWGGNIDTDIDYNTITGGQQVYDQLIYGEDNIFWSDNLSQDRIITFRDRGGIINTSGDYGIEFSTHENPNVWASLLWGDHNGSNAAAIFCHARNTISITGQIPWYVWELFADPEYPPEPEEIENRRYWIKTKIGGNIVFDQEIWSDDHLEWVRGLCAVQQTYGGGDRLFAWFEKRFGSGIEQYFEQDNLPSGGDNGLFNHWRLHLTDINGDDVWYADGVYLSGDESVYGMPDCLTSSDQYIYVKNFGYPVLGNEFSSVSAPMSISGGASMNITVPSGSNPWLVHRDKIEVEVDIEHPDVSEVTLTLDSPDGSTVILYQEDIAGGADFTDTVFSDIAFRNITEATPSNAPFTFKFRPKNSLSILNNENAQGTWTLNAIDNVNSGTLNSWKLNLTHVETSWMFSHAAYDSISGGPRFENWFRELPDTPLHPGGGEGVSYLDVVHNKRIPLVPALKNYR